MTEWLDIYDENRNHIGVKDRAAVHRDGDWHCTFHCWIVYQGEQDTMVVQRRSPNVDSYPNMLDITAAGHYTAGERLADGLRELHEELGIDVAFEDLRYLGTRVGVYADDGLVDHGFNEVFLLDHDAPLESYQFDRHEISSLLRFTIDDGLALFSGAVESIPAQAVGEESGAVTLTRDDFIPSVDNYMYRICILAKRFLNGEKHLAI